MINELLKLNYLNNLSDIIELFKDNYFINIYNTIEDKTISFKSNLIHKITKISIKEQFIFNIDNYITFIKNNIFINNNELKYILFLTLHNNNIRKMISDKYYYENVDYYHKLFIKIFMYNYNKNVKLLSKFINIEYKSFYELVEFINTNKKRIYPYFENINNKNINFYINLIN